MPTVTSDTRTPRTTDPSPPRARGNKALLVAAVTVVLLVVGYLAVTGLRGSDTASTGPTGQTGGPTVVDAATLIQVPARATASYGIPVGTTTPTAPTVDVYLDYQCPFCKNLHATLWPRLTEAAAAGDINLVVHPLAFLGRESLVAANAAVCANEAGKFDEYTAAVYRTITGENTGQVTPAYAVALGGDTGLTDPWFTSCVNSYVYAPWLTQATDFAFVDQGIQGTPAVFVEGQQVPQDDALLNGDWLDPLTQR